jgi:hypothetical protein
MNILDDYTTRINNAIIELNSQITLSQEQIHKITQVLNSIKAKLNISFNHLFKEI